MIDDAKLDYLARVAVFPILLLVFLIQAIACRGIFADGANFFLMLLQEQKLPWFDIQRMSNHFLSEAPTLLLLKLDVHDLVFLRYFFFTWLMLCPLAMWAGALWNLRHDVLFWPFVMLMGIVYFGPNFFAIGEYNLCYATAAYCFSLLMQPLPEDKWKRVSLFAAAIFLPLQYAATLFLGTLLLLLVVIKPEAEWRGASRAYRFGLAFFFTLSVATAIWEVMAPRDPAMFATAQNTFDLFRDAQLWCVFGYAVLATLAYATQRMWVQVTAAVLCALLMVVLYGSYIRLYPYAHYAVRAYLSVFFSSMMCGVWLLRAYLVARSGKQNPAMQRSTPALAFALLIILSVYDVNLSLDYKKYLDTFRDTVNNHTGLIPLQMSGIILQSDNDRFQWGWTFPLLSVMLRDNAQKGIILNSPNYQGYVPFPPDQPPNLDMYYR